jgi:hypothetical protein
MKKKFSQKQQAQIIPEEPSSGKRPISGIPLDDNQEPVKEINPLEESKEVRFTCEYCGRSFLTQAELDEHLKRSHPM